MTPKAPLAPDAVVVLPSGNAVRLIARTPCGEWVCEYLPGCNARGEVVFSTAWLHKFAQECVPRVLHSAKVP